MTQQLADALLDAGMIQFGIFGVSPIRLNLHLLPAYPPVLREAATAVQTVLAGFPCERIIATVDTVPLGVMCSQLSSISLVYSRGGDAPPALDLVGAYDVGHPAVILANSSESVSEIRQLTENAGRVGLNVHAVIYLIQTHQFELRYVKQAGLIQLSTLVDQLEQAGRLPAGQSQAVRDWVKALETPS